MGAQASYARTTRLQVDRLMGQVPIVVIHCCGSDSAKRAGDKEKEDPICEPIKFQTTEFSQCSVTHMDRNQAAVTHMDRNQAVESLSYDPHRFDEMGTLDTERSHVRYSRMPMYNGFMPNQSSSSTAEEWLLGSIHGRPVVFFGWSAAQNEVVGKFERIQATFFVDECHTRLTINSVEANERQLVMILVDDIQMVCAAKDFDYGFDDGCLTKSERDLTVLIQHMTESDECSRVFFRVDGEFTKDRFVKSLTALWLEKRCDSFTRSFSENSEVETPERSPFRAQGCMLANHSVVTDQRELKPQLRRVFI